MHRDGALYETGPNSALDTTPHIDELLDALGIRGERVDASAVAATRYIVRDGKLVAAADVARARSSPRSAFTLGAKFRLWREPFVPPAPPDVEESIAAFVRRRLGTEFLDYAVDPFVAGVYAGDPERISVSAAFPRLHALEQRYGSLIKGQFQGARERRRAAGTAANAARQLLVSQRHADADRCARAGGDARRDRRARSTRVERDADGDVDRRGQHATENRSSGGRGASSSRFRRTWRRLSCATSRRTRRKGSRPFPYAPIASVATAYRRADIAHPLAGFGFLVPRRERRKILGCLFSSSMFEGRAPDGSVLLTTFVGGAREPELAGATDAELAAIVAGELGALVGARAEPAWTAITRWTHAIPQYNLGHRRPAASGGGGGTRAARDLHFCANYRGGVSVGDRIQAARAMAEAVARSLGPVA